MDIQPYLRVLYAHSGLIVAVVVVCTVAAGAFAWTREPIYSAHTQLFVSTPTESSALTPSQVYQGGLAAQSRAQSYARILSSPAVAEAVIEELDLAVNAEDLESAITATVPAETVVIDVTVENESAEAARDIADAVGTEFPNFVDTLESSPGPEGPPIEISVTSPAELPESSDSLPMGLYLAAGALLGFMLGVAAAVLRELLDTRIRDDEAAEAVAGAPVLGHIPHDRGASKRPLVMDDDTDSPVAEAYRRLRTNLRVVTLDRERRSLLLTSAVAGEGKTMLAANLGLAFAQAGQRVVLVDANLRHPMLGRLFGLESTPGLSEMLSGKVSDETLHRKPPLPLEVLTSGSPPSNPSELLGSDRFAALLERLTRRADIVIVDSPALLSVSDAAVVARMTAAVVMVARVPTTRADQLDIAAEGLRAVGAPAVGTVLNEFSGGGHLYRPRERSAAAAAAVPVRKQ